MQGCWAHLKDEFSLPVMMHEKSALGSRCACCAHLSRRAAQDAHEALYEMEMAALEAQRVAEATDAALEDCDDELEAQHADSADNQKQVCHIMR